jgi:hypothetical protein
MKNTFKPKPFKRNIHVAMMVLVEMEIPMEPADDNTARAEAILRHKMQTFAATNHDVAVSKMTRRKTDGGYDLEALP